MNRKIWADYFAWLCLLPTNPTKHQILVVHVSSFPLPFIYKIFDISLIIFSFFLKNISLIFLGDNQILIFLNYVVEFLHLINPRWCVFGTYYELDFCFSAFMYYLKKKIIFSLFLSSNKLYHTFNKKLNKLFSNRSAYNHILSRVQ